MRIEKNSCIRNHLKASEKYIDVTYYYDNKAEFFTSVPIEYRRTGTSIEESEIDEYLEKVGKEVCPSNWSNWRKEQDAFWAEKPKSTVTKSFFDVLSKDFKWHCTACSLPQNPNWARRIQDLKDFGYTLSTHTNMPCNSCSKNTTHLMLLPLKRGGILGYETMSPQLKSRIIKLLENYDAFEGKKINKSSLLPDHKFPEIRWDHQTKRESLDTLSDAEILYDFQLLTNQRNLHKREICRKCYQTGQRGKILDVDFFYAGSNEWDKTIPKTGKEAEKGCVGCAWYDIQKWRIALNKELNSNL